MDEADREALRQRRMDPSAVELPDVREALAKTASALWLRFDRLPQLMKSLQDFRLAAFLAIRESLEVADFDPEILLAAMKTILVGEELQAWFSEVLAKRWEAHKDLPPHLVEVLSWDENRQKDWDAWANQMNETAKTFSIDTVRDALKGNARIFTDMARKRVADPNLSNALDCLRDTMAALGQEIATYRAAGQTENTVPGRPPGPGAHPSLQRWTAAKMMGYLVESDPPWTEPELAALLRHLGFDEADRDWVHSLRRSPGLDPA